MKIEMKDFADHGDYIVHMRHVIIEKNGKTDIYLDTDMLVCYPEDPITVPGLNKEKLIELAWDEGKRAEICLFLSNIMGIVRFIYGFNNQEEEEIFHSLISCGVIELKNKNMKEDEMRAYQKYLEERKEYAEDFK